MDPDLIICGRTFSNTVSNLGLKKTTLLITENGKSYYYAQWEVNGHKALILQFWHPACRKNRQDTLSIVGKMMSRIQALGLIGFDRR